MIGVFSTVGVNRPLFAVMHICVFCLVLPRKILNRDEGRILG